MVDVPALRQSFGRVAQHGDEVPLYFYSYLFLRHPHLRNLFPPSMATQRDRLVGALVQVVTDVDRLDALVPFLRELGRDHRKFSVVTEHYPQVGEALLATLEHFLGPAWTPALAAEWTAAYGLVAEVMSQAAEGETQLPAWWDAEIVQHERRGPDVAVFTVAPSSTVPYRPGQSVSLETPLRARMWRYYSPANAPRPDGTLEFHVRVIDGGWVSSTLAFGAGAGDRLQLGPPVGDLVLDPDDDPGDLLMLAGGTGLAPLRAMVEQLADGPAPHRGVHLFVEARTENDLYDLPALDRMAARSPWLTVVPVARQGPVTRAEGGRAVEVALRQGRWNRHSVYVCGGPGMVAESRALLSQAGIDPARVHHETFNYRGAPAPESGTIELPLDDVAPHHDALAGDPR